MHIGRTWGKNITEMEKTLERAQGNTDIGDSGGRDLKCRMRKVTKIKWKYRVVTKE